jgi:predicted nucleic acid-binding protein
MMWAVARQVRCDFLISEDFQDGRQLEGVTFVNPFIAANATILEMLLGPENP